MNFSRPVLVIVGSAEEKLRVHRLRPERRAEKLPAGLHGDLAGLIGERGQERAPAGAS